jgi:NAD+--asparagine ADP-ribosyltransferase
MLVNFRKLHPNKKVLLILMALFFAIQKTTAQKDYKLWLQYNPIQNSKIANEYKTNNKGIYVFGDSETLKVALKVGSGNYSKKQL